MNVYFCVYTRINTCIYVGVYIHITVCMCVCLCTCIHMHIITYNMYIYTKISVIGIFKTWNGMPFFRIRVQANSSWPATDGALLSAGSSLGVTVWVAFQDNCSGLK